MITLTLYGHIKTAEQRTIIQQYIGAWYAPPSPLLAVPNVTAHPSTASVPTSYYLMWRYNCLWTLKGFNTDSDRDDNDNDDDDDDDDDDDGLTVNNKTVDYSKHTTL